MINLTQKERDVLHCKQGSREEFYKLELIDRYGTVKAPLEMIDGQITCDKNRAIQKTGTLKYRVPSIVRKTETVAPNANAILISANSTLYALGVETTGLIYTVPISITDPTIPFTQIKVENNGILFTENVTEETLDFELRDNDGYTWNVGVEANGLIFSQRTDQEQRIYYRDQEIEIDYLNDRLKVYMGVRIGNSIKWWAQGVFMNIKPSIRKGIVTTQAFDESIVIQRTRVLEPRLFLKGTNYVEVLNYLLIYAGITKINIEPTTLTLQTDIIIDSKRNNLDWFNYYAEQINYMPLSVDGEGWFVSKKYIEPTPLNVGYIYEANDMSVITGDLDAVTDNYNVPNVFRRTVSHPRLGELTSLYKNEDPTDKYSTVNTTMNYNEEVLDNVGSQAELDNLTRKAAFEAKQITQEITFNTLNMPHHTAGDILDLRHEEAKGIVVEQEWTMNLKAGARMSHKVKRLVVLNE